MKKLVISLLITLLIPALSWAHGLAGKRFFPSTLTVEDPFVSDEFSLLLSHIKEPASGEEPPTTETAFSGEFSKRLTRNLSFSLGSEFQYLRPELGKTQNGFGNLELGAKYQFFTSDSHEAILSIGIDTELGGTGSRSVGAESFSTISPGLFFGKGFGDLPESIKYLKPLAITGRVGPNFPTRSKNVTSTEDPDTGEIEQEIERNPVTFSWGLTIQYNLQYLQTFVENAGLKGPFNRMILLVEFPMEACLDLGCNGQTTGTINPGFVWFGKYVQLGIEAAIPINERSGKNVGIFALIHIFLDDLFPRSLGRPLFR